MKQEIREQEIIEQYQRWQECAVLDKDLKKELMTQFCIAYCGIII